jgi:eukaryotic-like serine/threonine-protein kinase
MNGSAADTYRVGGRFPLGEGIERRAIGDLYHATDEAGAPVQVLFVGPQVFPYQGMRERAVQELQAVMGIGHPNILRLLDVGYVEDGRVYCVTEVPGGATLASTIGTYGPLALPQSVQVISMIIAALQAARRVGVFHRDLSPSNVVLTSDGNVKLLHFGMAEPAGGAAFGDPWFGSPEQARGEPVSEAANMYSLGALWYYVVCGAPPFSDADPLVVQQRHQNDQPEAPSRLRPDLGITPAFEQLVLRMLAKVPSARFGTWDEIVAAMPGVTQPVRAEPAPGSGLGAAATILAPAGAFVSPAAPPEPTPQPQAVPAPAPVAAPAPAPQPVAQPQPQAKPQPAAAAAPRAKKKGFRETLWFMKGELGANEQTAESPKDLAEVKAGDGSISDKEKGLDERYRDDGSITAEDRRKFSIKTGQTGMMPAYQAPEPMAAGSAKDYERRKSALVWILVVLILLGGGGGAGAYFYLKPVDTFVKDNLGMVLLSQTSEYALKAEKKDLLILPPTRTIPTGEDKELLAKLSEAAKKPESFMPAEGLGVVDLVAVLERRLEEVEKDNAMKPKRKQVSLFQAVDRAKAKSLEKEYDEIRTRAITGLKEMVTKGLAAGKPEALKQAKSACLVSLGSYRLGEAKAELEGLCTRVDAFFAKPTDPPAEKPAPGGKDGMAPK